MCRRRARNIARRVFSLSLSLIERAYHDGTRHGGIDGRVLYSSLPSRSIVPVERANIRAAIDAPSLSGASSERRRRRKVPVSSALLLLLLLLPATQRSSFTFLMRESLARSRNRNDTVNYIAIAKRFIRAWAADEGDRAQRRSVCVCVCVCALYFSYSRADFRSTSRGARSRLGGKKGTEEPG